VDAVLYRTATEPLDRPGGPAVAAMIRAGAIDAVALTSGSMAEGFAQALRAGGLREAGRRLLVACIGPVTAEAAREAGFTVRVVAPTATSAGLAAAIAEHLAGRRP
jgi:uroporphyrinogen-III synthase